METRDRRFDLGDAAILAAAVAVAGLMLVVRGLGLPPSPAGLAPKEVTIEIFGSIPVPGAAEEPAQPAEGVLSRIVRRATRAILPVLMTVTPAVLILALRRPRPLLRRLLHRPGIAACAVATPVLAAMAVGYGLLAAWGAWKSVGAPTIIPLPPHASPVHPYPTVRATHMQELWFGLDFMVADCAYAQDVVAGAWLIMAVGRWWRPDRHWLDRLGRAVGFAWLLLMAAEFVVEG
jgi:hypothetical protein